MDPYQRCYHDVVFCTHASNDFGLCVGSGSHDDDRNACFDPSCYDSTWTNVDVGLHVCRHVELISPLGVSCNGKVTLKGVELFLLGSTVAGTIKC